MSPTKALTIGTVREISHIAEACCDFNDNWCETAVEAVSDFLDRKRIAHAPYFNGILDDVTEFGGCSADSSHAYIVLDDGTIIDPTIRQFRDSPRASAAQRKLVEGWPFLPAYPNVAVIRADNPFVFRMGYESHLTGLGWVHRPLWLARLCICKSPPLPKSAKSSERNHDSPPGHSRRKGAA